MQEEKAPVFLKIENYKDILSIVSEIEAKLNRAEDLINKIKDLKSEEDSEIGFWGNEIKAINDTIVDLGEGLSQPEF